VPAVALKTLAAQTSFDNGKTWHSVSVNARRVLLDPEATKKLDLLQPLPPQVPALAAVITDLIAGPR
jgi:hypothetical protein